MTYPTILQCHTGRSMHLSLLIWLSSTSTDLQRYGTMWVRRYWGRLSLTCPLWEVSKIWIAVFRERQTRPVHQFLSVNASITYWTSLLCLLVHTSELLLLIVAFFRFRSVYSVHTRYYMCMCMRQLFETAHPSARVWYCLINPCVFDRRLCLTKWLSGKSAK